MESRIDRVVRGAAQRLAADGNMLERTGPEVVRIEKISLVQLAALAGSPRNDPMVREVMSALERGKKVTINKPAVAKALNLADFSPSARDAVEQLFAELYRKGIELKCDEEVCQKTGQAPERENTSGDGVENDILSEILGEVRPEDHPCYVEPGVLCFGCGRCKTMGF